MDESDPKNFLEELHKEKKTLEKYIRQLEESITDNETKYLQNTVNGGNILRGWEHIFTSKSNKIHMGNQCKKNHISNNERLFSQTFEFDKNTPEEIINTTDKIITQTNTKVNWYSCAFCYCFGLIPWIIFQCCRNKAVNCLDADHYCPNCGNKIVEYNSC